MLDKSRNLGHFWNEQCSLWLAWSNVASMCSKKHLETLVNKNAMYLFPTYPIAMYCCLKRQIPRYCSSRQMTFWLSMSFGKKNNLHSLKMTLAIIFFQFSITKLHPQLQISLLRFCLLTQNDPSIWHSILKIQFSSLKKSIWVLCV